MDLKSFTLGFLILKCHSFVFHSEMIKKYIVEQRCLDAETRYYGLKFRGINAICIALTLGEEWRSIDVDQGNSKAASINLPSPHTVFLQ